MKHPRQKNRLINNTGKLTGKVLEGGVVCGWATGLIFGSEKQQDQLRFSCGLLIDVILLLDRICQMGMVDKWSILRKVKTIILLTKLVDIACHVSGIISCVK